MTAEGAEISGPLQIPGRSAPAAAAARRRRATVVRRRELAEPGQQGLRSALIRQTLLLLCIALLAAPAVTPLAGWVRWTFPACSTLLAGWLALRGRTAPYLTWCLSLFLFTPFVRRLVDDQIGYSHANVLMLAPYLAVAWAALQAPRFFLTPGRPAQWPIALVFAAILYGFVLALAAGRLFPGTLDLLRWSMPPLLACYIIARSEDWEAVCSELRAWAILALPLVSIYGLYQFVAPPSWDGNWMLHSGMNSIGQPQPFEVRVFSTLNSPASFAYYVEALLLITLALKLRLRWFGVALGMAALAVTLVRSAWLGLAIGMLLFLLRAPLRVRASALLLALAVVAVGPLALTNARVEDVVSSRMETLYNVGGDKSLSERLKSYSDSLRELSDDPWGKGLGITNVASNYTDEIRVIDGGPIEILLSTGLIFGSIYLIGVGLVLIAAIMCPAPLRYGDVFVACATIATVQALAFSSVTTVVGEIGILFWLAAGLVLAAPKHRQAYLAASP